MKLLHEYQNGNYQVKIFDDGTKIRETEENEFIADFPENIDIKISDRCDLGCAYCHENSTPNGDVAHFNHEFFSTLRPGTELAIGGGNVFENPCLAEFMELCKMRGIIANLTINQSHLVSRDKTGNIIPVKGTWDLLKLGQNNLLNGVGISYNGDAEALFQLYKQCHYYGINTNNFVIHTINGIHSFSDIMKLGGLGMKVLILGYKDVRRGIEFRSKMDNTIKSNQQSLYVGLEELAKHFKVVSFDNLALEQLEVKRLLSQEEWDEFYMGDDGSHTMYIDLCKEEFSMNSCAVNKRYKLMSDIVDMFKIVKEDKKIESTNS